MITRIFLVCCLFLSKLGLAQDTTFVHFNFDRYTLSSEAKKTLEEIIRPNLFSVIIYGHTDQLGSVAYNNRLSEQRASAVKDFLIRSGVTADKIKVVKGFGKSSPLLNGLDESSRSSNRRVQIITQYEVTAKDSVVMEEKPKVIKPKTEPSKPKIPSNNTPVRKTIKENLITEVIDSTTKTGDNIVLKNINFYGGRHVFLPEAYTPLDELLTVMQTIPTLEIEIQGHICCQAGEGDGLDIDTGEPFLSYNRARAVYDYLVEHGIDKKRLKYKGYGHKSPIIEFERTETERTTNRRVEIKILKK